MNTFDLSKKIAAALPTYAEQVEAEQREAENRRGAAQWAGLKAQSEAWNATGEKVRALNAEIAEEHGYRAAIETMFKRVVENSTELATLKIEGEFGEVLGLSDKDAAAARKKKVEALTAHNTAIMKEQIPAAIAKLRKFQARLPELLAKRNQLLHQLGV